MSSQTQTLLKGKLNTFQQTMLQWDELHPYNAVHVVRLLEKLDPTRLRAAIEGTLQHHGLTNLTLQGKRARYAYAGGRVECQIEDTALASGEPASLRNEIERQLNRRFDSNAQFNPFRFFVAPSPGSFWLGVTYFHPVADAESLVHLMKTIVEAYKIGDVFREKKIDLYPEAKVGWLRHPGAIARKILRVPKLVRNLRSSCRPAYRNAQDLTNGFEYFSIEPPALPMLTSRAKSWEVTLNDLFLGLLIQALSPLASRRVQGAKRRNLSIGCIVNTRRDHGLEGDRVFGVFLGSFILTQRIAGETNLRDLIAAIRQKTRAVKRGKLYLGGLELIAGRWLLPLFSTQRRKKLYQKHYPLWGGITNMNLNSLWPAEGNHPRLDYFRAVSTGPVTPFVLSVTTVNQAVHIGVTYRKTVFDPTDIEQIKSLFLDGIERLKRE